MTTFPPPDATREQLIDRFVAVLRQSARPISEVNAEVRAIWDDAQRVGFKRADIVAMIGDSVRRHDAKERP